MSAAWFVIGYGVGALSAILAVVIGRSASDADTAREDAFWRHMKDSD